MTGLFTSRNFSLSEVPDLDGKVAVITISTQLLLHGISKLFIIARNASKYDACLDLWRRDPRIDLDLVADADADADETGPRTQFIQCDLADMLDAKRAAEEVTRRTERLDILLCHAGTPIIPTPTLSPQGIDTSFAANVVGHHILTRLLLPLLRSTITRFDAPDARIVFTASSLHMLCRQLDLDLLSPSPESPLEKRYFCYCIDDGIWRYARSKVGVILSAREFARRLMAVGDGDGDGEVDDDVNRNIYVNSFFPGNIATEPMDIWTHYLGTIGGKAFKYFWSVMGQSREDGAATALFLAASDRVREGHGMRGGYFVPIAKPHETSAVAGDMELAGRLWDWIEGKVAGVLGDGWKGPAVGKDL
ncbi:hypothetical protein FQN52_006755 [Onygenales sp. PD_12]|nr:hypothetical protein FQN52_006755 [Onygenales sp. PD_12]